MERTCIAFSLLRLLRYWLHSVVHRGVSVSVSVCVCIILWASLQACRVVYVCGHAFEVCALHCVCVCCV